MTHICEMKNFTEFRKNKANQREENEKTNIMRDRGAGEARTREEKLLKHNRKIRPAAK